MKKQKLVTVPSFFWESILEEKYSKYAETNELKKGQAVADRIRTLIERFNERVVDIRNNPTANDPQKSLQIEKIAKQTKSKIEEYINSEGKALSIKKAELEEKISRDISDSDRIMAMETRQKVDRMSKTEKTSFLRQLQGAGDWESIKHVLDRSPAYLGILDEDYADIRQGFIKGRHPEISQSLEITRGLSENLKKGSFAVLSEFDEFESGIAEKSEKAKKALSE